MSGGGKGGGKTSSVSIPEYITDASKANLKLADKLSNVGYTPYYGPDVAAMSPMQQASMQGTDQMAGAFGMPTTGGQQYMPEPTTFAGGVQGYSSAPLFEQAQMNLQQYRPAQAQYMDSFFMNPQTGAAGENAAPLGSAESFTPVTNTPQFSPLGVAATPLPQSGRGKG